MNLLRGWEIWGCCSYLFCCYQGSGGKGGIRWVILPRNHCLNWRSFSGAAKSFCLSASLSLSLCFSLLCWKLCFCLEPLLFHVSLVSFTSLPGCIQQGNGFTASERGSFVCECSQGTFLAHLWQVWWVGEEWPHCRGGGQARDDQTEEESTACQITKGRFPWVGAVQHRYRSPHRASLNICRAQLLTFVNGKSEIDFRYFH